MNRNFVPINVDADLTPAEVDRHLRQLRNHVALSQIELERCRDDELEAKKAFTKARTRLLLSPECPRVSRGGSGVTVDERDAWIISKLDEEFWALEGAKVNRENAEDYGRSVREQIKCIQSLGASARQAYEIAGRSL